jgi:L-threonylcarbamoyladenylate synthase
MEGGVGYYGLTFQTGVDRALEPVAILQVNPDDGSAPRRAVETLRAGGLIVFPTEEGYLVGCNALDARAVGRLCQVTGATADSLVRLAATPEQELWLGGPARRPQHPVPLALMQAAGVPMVATTVPPGGRPLPSAQHVVFVLGDAVDLVLNAGRIHPHPAIDGR